MCLGGEQAARGWWCGDAAVVWDWQWTASSMESQLWERAALLLGAQHRPCPGTGEQLAQHQMPKWNRSPHPQSGFLQSWIHIPVAQTPPQHLAHAPRDAPPLSKALVLLPASCRRPGSLLPSAFSSSHFPGLEGELSWCCLCQRQAQGNGNGWCCSPGCLPGKLWLYLLSQAPWERNQGLPGAGGGAGAAPDPWARSEGLFSFQVALQHSHKKRFAMQRKTSHPPHGSMWAGSGAGSSCAPMAWAPRSCSCPMPCPGPFLPLAPSPFQLGSWRPSEHRAPRTELCLAPWR